MSQYGCVKQKTLDNQVITIDKQDLMQNECFRKIEHKLKLPKYFLDSGELWVTFLENGSRRIDLDCETRVIFSPKWLDNALCVDVKVEQINPLCESKDDEFVTIKRFRVKSRSY